MRCRTLQIKGSRDRHRLARSLLVVIALASLALPTAALAEEPADLGISLSAWVGQAIDQSITIVGDRDARNGTTSVLGVTGLGNIGPLALGAAADGTPGLGLDGWLALSALLGVQSRVGGARLHLLGEVGSHLFSGMGAERFERQLGSDRWLRFVGLRLGAAQTMADHSRFELGMWLFSRYDLAQATMSTVGGSGGDDARTDYRVGGFTTGIAFQVGVRFERPPRPR
jgi:hypothetical protein